MNDMFLRLIKTIAFLILILQVHAQHEDSTLPQLPSQYLDKVSSKANQLEQKLDKKSKKALQQMMKQEARMKSKLAKIDSSKAREIFGDAKQKYNELEQRLQKGT